jgi:hypothetical protein
MAAVRDSHSLYRRYYLKRLAVSLARWFGALTGLLLGMLLAIILAILNAILSIGGLTTIIAAAVAFAATQVIDRLFIRPTVGRLNWRLYWHFVWTLLTIGAVSEIRLAQEEVEQSLNHLAEMCR